MDWLRTSAMVTALFFQACGCAIGGEFPIETPPASSGGSEIGSQNWRSATSRSPASFSKDPNAFVHAAIRDFMRPGDPFEGRADAQFYEQKGLSCAVHGDRIEGPAVAHNGPMGTAHYNIRPNWKQRLQNCGKTASHCAFYRLADAFHRACDGVGCRVIYGDFYSPIAHGIHVSHSSGNCVDVLPFRNVDDKVQRTWYGSKNYSRERTRAFIELARAMGATNIIFADPQAKPDLAFGGHSDHIHLCFPEKSPLVRAACKGESATLIAALEEAEREQAIAEAKRRPPAPPAKPVAAKAPVTKLAAGQKAPPPPRFDYDTVAY